MKITNDLKKCMFAYKIMEKLCEISDRKNKKFTELKDKADKYIKHLERDNQALKIDNAQLTAQIYNGYKKKVKERKAKCIK